MPELDAAEVVGLHQGVARRRNVLAATERGEAARDQGARERALAGSQSAGEPQEVTREEMRRQGAGEPFGCREVGERQG